MRRTNLVAVAALIAALVLAIGYAQPAVTPHAPIYISGNAGFTPANGVTGGLGTQTQPYTIENWDIDGTGATNGIYIENTDAYFIIRNCRVYNADADGIHFLNVKHGVITTSAVYANNVVVGPYRQVEGKEKPEANCGGIWSDESTENEISKNEVVENHGIGICLTKSTNHEVLANGVARNEAHGIWLWKSDTNQIAENTVANNNSNGILLVESNLDQIIENTVTGNGIGGPGASGVLLFYSSINEISRNVVTANHRNGILLHESANNNRVMNNTVTANTQYGIVSWTNSNNLIYHNNLLNNSTNGYDSGTNQWDNGYPSGGNYWSDFLRCIDYFSGPGQNQSGSDGKCDSAYRIPGGNNRDRYPLVQQYTGP